jgi:hypothetical protein
VGGEAGKGEENCPARAGAGSGKKSEQFEDVFKCRRLFWWIFLTWNCFF